MPQPSALFLLVLVFSQPCLATEVYFTPETAHTDIYFPHFANGGSSDAQWQSRFTFINPSGASTATVSMSLFANDGSPLPVDFGSGAVSGVKFSIPPNGTYVLTSNQATSLTTSEGWAYAQASIPVEATVAFRLTQKSLVKLEITAAPTLPTPTYRSVATPQVGIAVANAYTNTALSAIVEVFDSTGQILGQTVLQVPPLGHTAFNLFQAVPNLPSSFTGNVVIAPQNKGQMLVAWVLYSDSSGVISSLPEGRAAFPISQADAIEIAFSRLVDAYQRILSDFGPVPKLVISSDSGSNAINAVASNGTTVTINLALAELIGDSASELGFVVGHELGHIYQQRTGKFLWYPNDREWDADSWGLLMSLYAGYDPYGGSGALGKLGMATGTTNLGIQMWEDSQLASDAHGSFSTRISNLSTVIETVCASSQSWQSACNLYKSAVHPHFPASPYVPLEKKPLSEALVKDLTSGRTLSGLPQ